jgi:hypothetical protein
VVRATVYLYVVLVVYRQVLSLSILYTLLLLPVFQ